MNWNLLGVLLLLALASAADAQSHHELRRTYTLEEGAGSLTVRPLVPTRLERGPKHQVSVRLTYAGGVWAGAGVGEGKRTTATLTRHPLTVIRRGLSGSLRGEPVTKPSASCKTLTLELVESGNQARLVLREGKREEALSARRAPLPTSRPEYDALSARTKLAALWTVVREHPYDPTSYPRLGSKEAMNRNWKNNARLLANVRHLVQAFRSTADVRAPRWKLRHPFGSTARVVFVPAKGHPYTGLFRSGAVGLARLSLNVDGERAHNPGIGLKLLVDGQPSRNVLASAMFDPTIEDPWFFARGLTNQNSLGRLPLGHLAEVDRYGRAVDAPRAPKLVVFQPAVTLTRDTRADFRDLLARIPSGAVVYRVTDGAGVLIGEVQTSSRWVASDGQDRLLHFAHHNRPIRTRDLPGQGLVRKGKRVIEGAARFGRRLFKKD